MSKKQALKAKLRECKVECDRLRLILRNANAEVNDAIDSADHRRWDTALNNVLVMTREFRHEA